MKAIELQVGCLPGLTHSFGGLSPDNRAAATNRRSVSNPRAAAHQNLGLMMAVAGLGIPQAVLPPHDRPNIPLLRLLGFTGSDAEVLERALRETPDYLLRCSSSSFMWTANAATVIPGIDSADGRVHIVPANLAANLHRCAETHFTARMLRRLLPGGQFVHHPALPAHMSLGDEGAANHTRLGARDAAGLHCFAYGFDPDCDAKPFAGRQSLAASAAVKRITGLADDRAIFLRQNPEAIAAGAFHLDVVGIGNESLLLVHGNALSGQTQRIDAIRERLQAPLTVVEVPEAELPLDVAIRSYVFNSQIVTLPSGRMAMIAPRNIDEFLSSRRLVADLSMPGGPISQVILHNLDESMRGGGGPACLRLRLLLTPD